MFADEVDGLFQDIRANGSDLNTAKHLTLP